MKNLRSRRKSLTLKDNEDMLESVQYLNFRRGIFLFSRKKFRSQKSAEYICKGLLLNKY